MSTLNQKYKIFMKSSLFIGGGLPLIPMSNFSMRREVQVTNSAETGVDASIFDKKFLQHIRCLASYIVSVMRLIKRNGTIKLSHDVSSDRSVFYKFSVINSTVCSLIIMNMTEMYLIL